jgi:hypothetical protein
MARSAAVHSLISSAAQRSAARTAVEAEQCVLCIGIAADYAQCSRSLVWGAAPSRASPAYAAAATARTVRESTIVAPAVTKADRFGRACGVEGTEKFRWWYSQYYGAHGGVEADGRRYVKEGICTDLTAKDDLAKLLLFEARALWRYTTPLVALCHCRRHRATLSQHCCNTVRPAGARLPTAHSADSL